MKVYADNAATTFLSKTALAAMNKNLAEVWGNPSSVHESGRAAAEVLEAARVKIAAQLNAQPNEIYFTSGGTEADNWAVHAAAAEGMKKGKRHIISSTFEHHAISHTLEKWKKHGFEVTLLDVHEDGVVRPDELKAALRDDTCLVTIMFANNEIGTIQPVAELGAICREKGVPFHTDAVQAVGHVPVDVKAMNIDMLSLSAHKFHGPKGVGALYCRRGLPLAPMMEGGGQERRKRPGTESVPAIAAMADALEESCLHLKENGERVRAMRDRLIEALGKLPRTRVNGGRSERLPGIASFCFEGIEGEAMLLMLDMQGIAGSSGSACTSGSLDPSHVLLALGLPHEIAHGSLRLSLSEYNTDEDIDYIIQTLPGIIGRLRSMSPVWERIEKGE